MTGALAVLKNKPLKSSRRFDTVHLQADGRNKRFLSISVLLKVQLNTQNAPTPIGLPYILLSCAMPLNTREAVESLPAAQVAKWVETYEVLIGIETVLTTLIVYDAGEHRIHG